MKVSLLKVRLQEQSLLKSGFGLGKLISLRQQIPEIILQIGALGSEFHSATHFRKSLVPGPLAYNSRQCAMSVGVCRCKLHCGTHFLLRVRNFPLLREHSRQSEARLHESRLGLYRGSKMRLSRVSFPLLGQHPTEC